MCLGLSKNFSRKMVPSPKAFSASLEADSVAPLSSFSSEMILIPLPPPPAAAFTMTGYPISEAKRTNSPRSSPDDVMPGMIGTPLLDISFLDSTLSPIKAIASGGGPMKTSPASAHLFAKVAFSARNP
jgi:hypothetical protein